MFAQIEALVRRTRRRFSRSEWAIRHLGLTPSEGTSEAPGLLLIQIDGLPRKQLEAAIAAGKMPFLGRLIKRGRYPLHTFYPGLPTTTPAVQAELYYGVRGAVPAFSFLDRDRGEIGVMYSPEWAKSFEEKFQLQSEGLLKGGSCWSNIYTGGASLEESHFCAASSGLGDMWRTGKLHHVLLFFLLQLPSALRIIGLLLLETVISIPQALRGVFRGEGFKQELIMVISRIFVGIALREVVTIGGKVDVTRGLPIVHLNFLGYDELSHRRGPGSAFAHWSLRGIDRAIKNLASAAHRSTRRDYQVWIFSDHGQERTRSFATEFPGGVERIVADCLELARARDPAWRVRSQRPPLAPGFSRGPRAEARRLQAEAANRLTDEERRTFSIAAMGPVGHVYFGLPMDAARKRSVAGRLVTEGKIPGVLLKDESGAFIWVHADGETAVPGGVAARLTTHPEAMREEVARDLATFCANSNAGDLILLGWCPKERPWSFAPERGAHAGPGPDETQGFLLVPPATRLPQGAASFVRPSGLRAAALHLLGRDPLGDEPALEPDPTAISLRVMTYNTHRCSGMDGRVSPRRIARVIAHEAPEIIALQELDHGHTRSRGEDQASLIAAQLGYHVVFCPTVVEGEVRYGHAVLSRSPIEVIKVGPLPHDPRSWWPETRSALWIRIRISGNDVHVVTTHLGLSPKERVAQMHALLGPDWLGPVYQREPVILCGDFNLVAGSAAYGVAASHLFDVQAAQRGHRPLGTFSSAHPLVRIDHIFVSRHFQTLKVQVPRTELTRIASDHLPLVADVSLHPPAPQNPE